MSQRRFSALARDPSSRGAKMFLFYQKKYCSKCEIEKSLSDFSKNVRRKDGYHSICKSCSSEYDKQRWLTDREKISKRNRRWRTKNAEKLRASKKEYASKNTERKHEADKRWREANKERKSENGKKWYQANLDKVRARARAWAKNNPLKRLEQHQKRRALKVGNGGTITAEEWKQLKEYYNYTCLCCKRREPEIKLTLDHVKPLVLGGRNEIENAQPLCLSCNCSKRGKHIDYR